MFMSQNRDWHFFMITYKHELGRRSMFQSSPPSLPRSGIVCLSSNSEYDYTRYIWESNWTLFCILHGHNCISVEDCVGHKINLCLIFFLLHSQVKIEWHYILIDVIYSVYPIQPATVEDRITIHNLCYILNYQSVS